MFSDHLNQALTQLLQSEVGNRSLWTGTAYNFRLSLRASLFIRSNNVHLLIRAVLSIQRVDRFPTKLNNNDR